MIFFYDIHIRILWRAVSIDFKSQTSVKKKTNLKTNNL